MVLINTSLQWSATTEVLIDTFLRNLADMIIICTAHQFSEAIFEDSVFVFGATFMEGHTEY